MTMLYYFYIKVLFLYEVLENYKHSFKDTQSLELHVLYLIQNSFSTLNKYSKILDFFKYMVNCV